MTLAPQRATSGAINDATSSVGGSAQAHGPIVPLSRVFALSMVVQGLVFVVSSGLEFWADWPGLPALFAHLGWFGLGSANAALDSGALTLGWIQFALYLGSFAGVAVYVQTTPKRALGADSETLSACAAYIIRAAFWAVLLIGLADLLISFLRVEGFLTVIVGDGLAKDLGRSIYRGHTIHYPLMVVSLVIAYFSQSLGFHWLALLIVVAEVQIVISRFVFSYEQAFMADLVRFWYGALFLFASPYTLIHEGHVRVDIIYTSFSERGKAWTNSIGSVVLGMPLCWVILTRGLWGRSNVISGPLLNFEVTQAGYGLYVKYLLAAFLLIFALSMLIQFASYFLNSIAVLSRKPDAHPDMHEQAIV